MDKVGATADNAVAESTGFFKYVFAFDDEVKCQIGNMIQYGTLALLPVLGILKAVQHLVPDEDDRKGSIILGIESFMQVALIFVLMWLSDRVIRYIPTMSGCAYGEFQPIAFVLPFLIILATMQTKLGAKLNLIVDRIIGEDELVAPPQKGGQGKPGGSAGHGGGVRVTQPLAQQGAPQHHPSQADSLDQPGLLPSNRQLTTMPATDVPSQVAPQKSPDFNQMYQNEVTPLQKAATPGGQPPQLPTTEPMAANEALGGGFGSSW